MALNLSDLPGTWTVTAFGGPIQGKPKITPSCVRNDFAQGRHILIGSIPTLSLVIILLPKEHFHEFGPYPNTQEYRN